jgi:ABC-2 type transport system permease protein
VNSRVFWQIFSVEARKRMSYRTDFWINSLGGLAVNLSVYWALSTALFHSSGKPLIAGYTQQGLMLYYIFATLTSRIVQSGELDMATAQEIYDGSLSRYLLYPIPYTAVKYAQQWGALAPQMLQLAFFGMLAPFIVSQSGDTHISAASIAMYAGSLIMANLLHFILMLPIQAVAFWADNVWSLAVATRFITALLGGLTLPLEMFPDWARPVIDALPFVHLFNMPTRAVLGKLTVAEWATGLGVAAGWCVLLAIIMRWVWRRGELQYTGVGI